MSSTVSSDAADLLTRLGVQYGTGVEHGFCAFYDRHLHRGRERARKILVIGVGGGPSLFMWRDYFPNAIIHGIGLERVDVEGADRITIHVADQADRAQLQAVIQRAGGDFDVVIDDGGHTMVQQQTSLGVLFPHVRAGGFYVVGDLHTSFVKVARVSGNGAPEDPRKIGVDVSARTTLDVVDALLAGETVESEFMLESERDYLGSTVERVEIFDREGDRRQMTCIIRKKPFSPWQNLSMRLLQKLLG
ncbi:MAG: hypothetical protein R3174_06645 [Gammaproteobacteria bacterium]|nr:hypothetical protein [Gammaproteobacteria bacterium]